MHGALVVFELGTQRVGEALDRMLGTAIRRLQRDRAVRERRADLHDDAAVTRTHALQGRHRAPHEAVIGDVGDAAVVVRGHLHDRREDGEHGVVDPDVDRPEARFDFARRTLDGVVIGDVERQHHRFAAVGFDLALRGFESVAPARDERDSCFPFPECARRGAADAGRGAGDDDDFAHDVVRSKM